MLEAGYYNPTTMEGIMTEFQKQALAAAALKGLNTKGAAPVVADEVLHGKYHDMDNCGSEVQCGSLTQ